MKQSESSIIHFVRSVTLLAILLAMPGIAIFWNHLPKDIANQSASKATAPQTEIAQQQRNDSIESALSISPPASESIYPPLPEMSMAPAFSNPAPKVASETSIQQASIQQVSWDPSRREPPQNFESLEHRLKALGATYYRLEKWGNRGELFRFSCFVTPSDSNSYEKHFQSIGADAVTVMRSVIAEIETWKAPVHE